jgi:2-amino-4-hydroxy-6-hydroxymethyldihydropteridine diphosphokinase
MIIVALGANLPSRFGTPAQTLYAALKAMAQVEIWPVQISRVWKTAPVPFVEGDPWYYNAVCVVETDRDPEELLQALLQIEEDFGRVRTVKNAPRLLDLDLIAYDDEIIKKGEELIVPHPRMQERAFVLMPMSDVIDEWAHPETERTLEQLLAALPEDQKAEPVEGGWDE